MYKATFDRLAQQYTRDRYASEFAVAREDFARKTGKVFEDEPMYESRMAALLEWYLLDRCMWDTGIPPVRLHRLIHQDDLSDKERKTLLCLEESQHSIFFIKAVEKEKLIVKELFDDEEYSVSERAHFPGVHKRDIVDARLFFFGNEYYFTDSLWVHPADAFNFISSEAKKLRGEKQDTRGRFLFDLAYIKLKRDRYLHVSTAEIYNWESLKRDRQESA